MGDPSRYPEIRMARHMYALQWLPRDIRDDRPLLQQWIDNNLSYLDARALEVFQSGDADFRRASWSVVPEPDGKPTGTFIVLLSGRWLGLPVRCQGGIHQHGSAASRHGGRK